MIYVKLFWVFARIGLFGFGGGMAMLPMIYQGAKSFGLMTESEFSNLVAISQVTPGPIAVNAATYVGYDCAGILGALAATFGVAVPSFIIVTIVYIFVSKFKSSTLVDGAFAGIRPVTVGLIASAVIFIGRGVFITLNPVIIAICLGTILLIGKFKISPIIIMIIGGVIGAMLCG